MTKVTNVTARPLDNDDEGSIKFVSISVAKLLNHRLRYCLPCSVIVCIVYNAVTVNNTVNIHCVMMYTDE